jgi:surfeit locus 1 family protein
MTQAASETSPRSQPLQSPWRRWIVLAATIAGLAITLSLGRWQLDRAAQKEALQAALEQRGALPSLSLNDLTSAEAAAPELPYRRGIVRGQWMPERTVFLDNRPMNGQPGFYVLTPFKLAGQGAAIVVQRGWVPRDVRERTRLPAVPTPEGEVVLQGHIAPPPAKLYQFSGADSGPIRQNLDLAFFEREIGTSLWPVSFVQADLPLGSLPDGLLRQWPKPAVDVHKHYGYAFQWFALGALIAGLYVWFQLVRPRIRAK